MGPFNTPTSDRLILDIQIRPLNIFFFFLICVRSFTTISLQYLKISYVKNIRVYQCPYLINIVVYTKLDSFSDSGNIIKQIFCYTGLRIT